MWEVIKENEYDYRLWIPTGWLVKCYGDGGAVAVTFVPDPEHLWQL